MLPVALFRQDGAGLETPPVALFRQDWARLETRPVALFRQHARGPAKRSAAAAPTRGEGVDFIAISQISSFWDFAEMSFGEAASALEPIGSLWHRI